MFLQEQIKGIIIIFSAVSRARGRRSGRSPPLAQLTALASGASTRRMHNTDAHRDACAAALANQAALH